MLEAELMRVCRRGPRSFTFFLFDGVGGGEGVLMYASKGYRPGSLKLHRAMPLSPSAWARAVSEQDGQGGQGGQGSQGGQGDQGGQGGRNDGQNDQGESFSFHHPMKRYHLVGLALGI